MNYGDPIAFMKAIFTWMPNSIFSRLLIKLPQPEYDWKQYFKLSKQSVRSLVADLNHTSLSLKNANWVEKAINFLLNMNYNKYFKSCLERIMVFILLKYK